ncbi:hypothetical protein ACGF0J_26835 [Nonomuraea sp. NPDC047897]|uniref:hypothetical protein n=1 Tax=Nonomuraea sp. NPDC047897 TaxID=3364346 RepID=UPI003716A159
MRRHRVYADETFTGPGGALRRAVGTRTRRWAVAITVLAGLSAAVAVTTVARPAELTFATLSHLVQSLMSVIVPCQGIWLAHDLRRAGRTVRVLPTLTAGMLLAAAIGVAGVLICATTLVVAPGAAAQNPWRHAGTVVVGSVLVQVVAGLVGTGLGLLLRSSVVAFSASIVLPMGLWFVLGAVDGFRPAQAWLAPYATVQNLLSGQMSAIMWAQWIAVFLLWGVGLNAMGAAWLKRWRQGDE